jgi:hypothetical protein
MRPLLIGAGIFGLLLLSSPAHADTVFPARLQMKEVEPGLFELQFTLPIVNNRKLRAEPVLPQVCTEVGERRIVRTATEYSEYRVVRCQRDSLFGKLIAVRGLLGTQVDVILFLELLDGRKYTATLKPARSAFLIPPPPSLIELAGSRAFQAMQSLVRKPEIIVLTLTLILLGITRKEFAQTGISFLLGYAVGYLLLQYQWVRLSSHFWVLFALVVSLIPIMDLLRKGSDPISRISPLWLTAAVVGLTFGGSGIPSSDNERLATFERTTAFLAHVGGVGGAICLIGMFFLELRQLWRRTRKKLAVEGDRETIAKILGITAFALIYLQLSGVLFGARFLPPAPIGFYLIAFAIGLWLGLSLCPIKAWSAALLALSAGAGMMLGHSGISPPLGSLAGQLSLFVIGVAILSGRMDRPGLVLPVAAAALLFQSWSAGAYVKQNISLPVAVSVGAYLAVAAIAYWSRLISLQRGSRSVPIFRVMGFLIAAAALALRMDEYLNWSDEVLGGIMAVGLLPLPLLSLGFAAAAFAVWPRRRRIRELLAVKPQQQSLHWAFLAAAFFALPILTVNVPNLLHVPAAPTGEAARHILRQTLSKTYHAFNLDDEDELYDRLSETVTENLVADIYLDSRRKLTNGVRQGAQVTVRAVDVVSVEDEVAGTDPSAGYTYQCTWAVTARVTHLQHVHHRRNIYSGTLLIKRSDDRWKIDRIALTSEDRVIVPWRSG